MMTHEEYLKKRAEKDAELAKQGIGWLLNDSLEAEYHYQRYELPFIKRIGLTVAEMYDDKFGISVRTKMERLFDENLEKFEQLRDKLYHAVKTNQPITNWDEI